MTLNPTAKIPPSNVLYVSREGVLREMDKRRAPKALKKLRQIYNDLTFIIEST